MSNDLIILAKCIKGRNRRIALLSIYLFLIVFLVVMIYLFMTVECPEYKDISYIPLLFLVLTLPFIYFIIKIARQPKEVMFYDVLENKIYTKRSKGGVFSNGYVTIDIQKVNVIYVVEKPKFYSPSIRESLEREIRDIPGLHFCMLSGDEYISTDFDDYDKVLIKLKEILPLEYQNKIIQTKN